MNRGFHIGGILLLPICAGVLTGWVSPVTVLGAGGLLLCAVMLLRRFRELPLWCYAAATAFCVGGLFLWGNDRLTPQYTDFTKSAQVYYGLVTEQNRFENYQTLELILTEGSPSALVGERFSLHTSASADILPGEIITFGAKAEQPSLMNLEGGNAPLNAFVYAEPRVTGKKDAHWRVGLERLRRRVSDGLFRLLPTEEGAVMGALVTGKRDGISSEINELYRLGGMSHFLSMSGQHLAVLLSIFGCVGEVLLPRRRLRLYLELGLAAALVGLSGFAPSMLRAGLMAVTGRAGMLLGRRSDGLNALGLTAVVLLLFDPTLSCSLSFLLSYLATMGILCFHQPFKRLLSLPFGGHLNLREQKPWLASAIEAVAVTPAALVLTTPLVSWYFGYVTPVSLFTNPLAYVPMTAALFLTLAAGLLLFVPFAGILAKAFAFGGGLCIQLIGAIAKLGTWLPFSRVETDAGEIVLWQLAVLVCLVLLWYNRKGNGILCFAAGLSACSLVTMLLLSPNLWNPPVEVRVQNHDDYVLVVYGRQAAIFGVPKQVSGSERLGKALTFAGIESVELLVTDSEKALSMPSGERLRDILEIRHTVQLDRVNAFEAVLFGDVKVFGSKDEGVFLDCNGIRTAKTFRQQWTSAHVLINGRGDVITKEGMPLRINADQTETVLKLHKNKG